jgi:hypothetical protein
MRFQDSSPVRVPVLDGPTGAEDGSRALAAHRWPPLQPTDEMRCAKGRLERLVDPPLQDSELLAMHGWLAPDGTLYSCGYRCHDALGQRLGFAHESDIEQAGYCKLSNLEWLVAARYCPRALTEAQWDTIERWYTRNAFPQAHFLRLTTSL